MRLHTSNSAGTPLTVSPFQVHSAEEPSSRTATTVSEGDLTWPIPTSTGTEGREGTLPACEGALECGPPTTRFRACTDAPFCLLTASGRANTPRAEVRFWHLFLPDPPPVLTLMQRQPVSHWSYPNPNPLKLAVLVRRSPQKAPKAPPTPTLGPKATYFQHFWHPSHNSFPESHHCRCLEGN
jgi:hypothetical protein